MLTKNGGEAIAALWSWKYRKGWHESWKFSWSDADNPSINLYYLRHSKEPDELEEHCITGAKYSGCSTQGDDINAILRLTFHWTDGKFSCYFCATDTEPRYNPHTDRFGSEWYTEAKLLTKIEFDEEHAPKVSKEVIACATTHYKIVKAWEAMPSKHDPYATNKIFARISDRPKPQIKIKLARTCTKGAPDVRSPVHFKAGDEVSIGIIDFPGKPRNSGSVGTLVSGPAYKDWSFWTSGDIDCALIFELEDVSELIITGDVPEFLSNAPFPVKAIPFVGYD